MTSNDNWYMGCFTDTGPIKEKNEDYYSMKIVKDRDGEEMAMAAVADGMGGYQGGDLASRTAVQLLVAWWEKHAQNYLKRDDPIPAMLSALNELCEEINKHLLQEKQKAGTTLSILLLYKGMYGICHVGDSRIYRLKEGQVELQTLLRGEMEEAGLKEAPELYRTDELKMDLELYQLTEDHTWVEQQVRAGRLSKEAARTHPKRNVLTQCLGVKGGVDPYNATGTYQPSDLFMLCSDGFYSMFSHQQITHLLERREKKYVDLQKTAVDFVTLANQSGTSDNTTVMLVRNAFVEEQERSKKHTPVRKSLFKRLFK
ncbi:protein phosphatase [Evansella caseinilytica]|uniref:Protein phosphatase n=1 Tax=Evansella caseinilytica TaxID=1503961 RepID=A0A1H3QWZ1_9BACI|nr:protein phosphatase 2C domain-containing protein [Evansella caseinilytica]SDZ17967.1 protein phosphatase [Evansella caseinilytica]